MAETEIIIRPQTTEQTTGQATGQTTGQTAQTQAVQTAGQAVAPLAAPVIPPVVPSAVPSAVSVGQAGATAPVSPAEQNGQAAEATLLTKALLASPEDYVFQFAPETIVDTALIEDFKRFAFEQKMSLENARLMAKFYEKYVLGQSKKQSQEQAELLQTMQKACEEDREFGGMSFHDNMRYAKAAILRFDDGSLAKILNDTGFGSHPEVVRFMYRVGKALAEKEMPKAKESLDERSAAELFYPSMRKD